MADNETIADIIAEKRRQADEIERDVAEKMKRNAMISDRYARELVADIRREADRLEAALKRELSKNTSQNGADFVQLGDAAKLREALDESRRIASDLGGCRLNDYWKLNEIVRVCDAALAAPPRNCDRFKTAAEAIDAYQDLTGDQLATDSGMKEWVEFAVWLFATATEKEGGNDGK